MTMRGSHVTAQIRQRSVVLVESTMAPDVSLDAWRRRALIPAPPSTRARLAAVVLQAVRTPKVRVT
jgi:hypothetical protein